MITEPEGQSLAQRWPDIADSLRRYLASRGVSSHDNDDLVQQVAMTALTTPQLDQIENLEAWAVRVARNLHIDAVRKQARGQATAWDGPAGQDVEDQVTSRLRLAATLRALAELSTEERKLVVGATEGSLPPVARREAVRRNVQIFRIRQRLRTASLTAAVAGWWLRPRFRWVTPGAATALLPAALLVPVLVLPLLPPGHGAGSGSEPADASVVTRLLESRDVPLQLACGRCAAPAAPRRPTARPSAPNTESLRQRQSTVVTQTPVGPVGVAAESTARRGRELVCVGGITPGWRETCLDDPTSMPSAARL